ncbi:MAG: methyltransferase domain-containing protein [Sandaracinaceae bacterium]|nr:methyltransferase domain-containing protein [Sandaracinaceae bacterium]
MTKLRDVRRCRRAGLLMLGLAPFGAGCAGAHEAQPPEHSAGSEGHGARAHGGEAHGEGHQHRFEDPAAYAAAWESPERDAWQQPAQLVATLGIVPGMRVADIGTGTGYLLRYLSEATGPEGRVYAIDVERAMVDWVTERARTSGWTNVTPVLAPYDGPGVAPASLDRAIMVNVWHHIEARDVYARNLREALAPGGAVLVVETRLDAPEGPPLHYRLPPEQVMAELRAADLDVALSPYANSRQYAVLATRPR